MSSFSPTPSTPRSLNSWVAAATIARRFSAACSLDTPKSLLLESLPSTALVYHITIAFTIDNRGWLRGKRAIAIAHRYEAFSYEAGAVLHRNDIWLDSS